MISRMQLLLALAALLLTATLALASPSAPEAQPAPAVTAAQPLAAAANPAPLCPGANFLTFTPEQPTAIDSCGSCSDAACVGKMVNAVCGVGFRCIPQGTCAATPIRHCRCLII